LDREQCRERLRDLIRHQQTGAAALIDLLQREREALQRIDGGALESASREKTLGLEQLESLERQREDLLAAAGFSADPAGMERCLAWCDGDGELSSQWASLLKTLNLCQRENRVNGGAIELSRQRVEAALALLRGQAGSAPGYGADGHKASDLGNRTLGKA
jgi:flagellar biosynthesis/type III secretory pathway chaperone